MNRATEGLDQKSQGVFTQKKLDKLGIKSPDISKKVQITRKLALVPNREFVDEEDKRSWIEEMKLKYKVK